MVQKLANKQHCQGKNQGHFTPQPAATSQKLYVSTNTICENNIPDILFLRTFDLNSTYSARGNVSYLFFFLRDKHTTFYGRLRVLYVSTI
jgi:hypothetical protein